MARSKIENVLERHYKDMLDLNKRFIGSMSRPRVQTSGIDYLSAVKPKKLSTNQLKALARGREILKSNRSKPSLVRGRK